jgi:hypothetical protein
MEDNQIKSALKKKKKNKNNSNENDLNLNKNNENLSNKNNNDNKLKTLLVKNDITCKSNELKEKQKSLELKKNNKEENVKQEKLNNYAETKSSLKPHINFNNNNNNIDQKHKSPNSNKTIKFKSSKNQKETLTENSSEQKSKTKNPKAIPIQNKNKKQTNLVNSNLNVIIKQENQTTNNFTNPNNILFNNPSNYLNQKELPHTSLYKNFENGFNPNARFFIMKSGDEDNIYKSIKYRVWCSSFTGNKILNEAFKNAKNEYPIYLIFSVNRSGRFVGICQMISEVNFNSTFVNWNDSEKYRGYFFVVWVSVKDVPSVLFANILNKYSFLFIFYCLFI